MGLNASGPISLAGTTVGQSIELELGGGGFTMISLNDAAVRGLAGVASGQISMPTNFWGKSSVSYWIGYLSTPSGAVAYNQIAASPIMLANGDLIFNHIFIISAGGFGVRFSRITKEGVHVASSNLIPPATTGGIGKAGAVSKGMLLDSSGNSFYVFGGLTKSDAGNYSFCYVSKISTSLSTVEATSLVCSRGTTSSFFCNGLTIASDGDIFASYGTLGLRKLNPTTLAINSTINTLPTNHGIRTISDGSLVGISTSCTIIFKASLAGVIGTQTEYLSSTWQPPSNDIAVGYDLANNNYICGNYNITAGGLAQIVVINPLTMVTKWAYQTNLATQPGIAFVTYDSDGNIYAGSTTGLLLCKFNSSGTLIWQRSFTTPDTTARMTGLTATDEGIYIQWMSSTALTGTTIIAKLPKDGSKTGVYAINGVTLTYAIASYTITAFSTATTVTASYATYPPVYYVSTPTVASATTTFTPNSI